MHFIVPIHTNQSFVTQWHNWIHKQVSKHFRHGKDRIQDTVQDVVARLLQKDFIGRWFFKHLRAEFVDRGEAERMLGGVSLSSPRRDLKPVEGKCSDVHSLWRVDDVLNFANFDFERYYYTPQDHTIDSDKALQLLGYPEGNYNPLKSLWRQGRIRPAELTDHSCWGTNCPECQRGLAYLRDRKVSLSSIHDWCSPDSVRHAQKMRWNDTQFTPFLRNWRGLNAIHTTPRHIVRLSQNRGVDAGLLSYAQKVIDNHVVNCFKRMSRWEDMSLHTFNNGVSPEYADSEVVAWDHIDSDGQREETDQSINSSGRSMSVSDVSSLKPTSEFESQHDVLRMCEVSNLTDSERRILIDVDLSDSSVKEYAESLGRRSHYINKTRNSAINKIRTKNYSDSVFSRVEDEVTKKFEMTIDEILGGPKHGKHVLARREFFAMLFDSGVTIDDMASIYGMDIDRVFHSVVQASVAS